MTFKGLDYFYIVSISSTKQKNQKIFPIIRFNKDSLKLMKNYHVNLLSFLTTFLLLPPRLLLGCYFCFCSPGESLFYHFILLLNFFFDYGFRFYASLLQIKYLSGRKYFYVFHCLIFNFT